MTDPGGPIEFISRVEEVSFPDEWYRLSNPEHFWFQWRFKAALRQVRDVGLSISAPAAALEIGCGQGVLRDQFEAATPWTVDATDLHLPALNGAGRGRGRTLYYNILEEAPGFVEAYDVVILFDVLEHIAETGPFVRSVLRHLKPGGHLLINVPALQGLFSAYDTAAGHVRRYDRDSLVAEFCRSRPARAGRALLGALARAALAPPQAGAARQPNGGGDDPLGLPPARSAHQRASSRPHARRDRADRPPALRHVSAALRAEGAMTGSDLGETTSARARLSRALPFVAHVPVVLWVFAETLFSGRLLFFRDIGFYYYPNYVFLERALGQGVWPLWHPACDAGVPFLMADLLDLVLVFALGAEHALRFAPPLHLLVAMGGASFLARTLGQASWGTWAAGAVYGLSGVYLSTINLFELCHGMSWAPWVVAAFLRLLDAPGPRRAAVLGVLAAVQVGTLAAEVMLQTAVLGLLLVLRRPTRRAYGWLLVAGALAALLSAPALLGVRALVEGTARAAGFSPDVSLGWSTTPVVLLDMLLPRFFGNVHSPTDEGFWGQPFFTSGYPYLLSLYLGPAVLLLAFRAGRGASRLWLAAALGVLLSLGSHGPLGPLVLVVMHSFRTPAKFLFVATLALALLAGRGLDRSVRPGARGSPLALLPGAALLLAGLLLFRDPRLPARLFAGLVPDT